MFPDKVGESLNGHAPAPFFIAPDLDCSGTLHITLSLLGRMDQRREIAFVGFISAVTDPPGIVCAAPSPKRKSQSAATMYVQSANWERQEGIQVPGPVRSWDMDFATPVQFGPSDTLKQRHTSLMVGLAQRIGDLTWLFDCDWQPDPTVRRTHAETLRFDGSRLVPAQWVIRTNSRPPRSASGWLGTLNVADSTTELRAALAISSQLFCGRDGSKGFGRYALWPSA